MYGGAACESGSAFDVKLCRTFTDSEGAHLREDRFVCFLEIPSRKLTENAEK